MLKDHFKKIKWSFRHTIQYIQYNIFYLNTVKVKLMGLWHTEFIKTSQFLGNPYEPFTHQTFHNGLFWETDKMFVQ